MQVTVQGCRLSPGQKHLWLAQQGKPEFRAGCTVLIEGKLDVSALEEAFRLVIRRHEILRTTFRDLPGMKIPVQLVAKEVEFHLGRRLPEVEFEGAGPLHASLEALPDAKQLLHISLPSLCADAWSLRNLVQEIAAGYDARFVQTDDEVTQYVQFSEWQNELLEADAVEEGREFWREKYFSTETELTLPFEIQNPESSFDALSIRHCIDSDLRRSIESFAQQRNTTVEVVLLACWQSLLWRLLRKSPFIIGQTFHGRSYEELHGALGLFARDLPIQCQFEEHSSFSDVLEQCRQAMCEAYQWQDYFTLPAADAGRRGFGFEYSSALPVLSVRGVRFSMLAVQLHTEPFKLKLTCREDGANYLLELRYDAGKIERTEAERLARRYVHLVRAAVGGSDVQIRRLEILDESERKQILVEWNRTKASYGLSGCVHEVIEQQAARGPEEMAVICEEEGITYGELNRRANQLAHYLRACGIGVESRVGLLLERSVESVIALLGVLKAGAAYVPLDLGQPAVRLEWMLADAGVEALITRGELAVELPAGVKLIRLDAEEIGRQSEENPAAGAQPENLAYVIYTSGSTGQAKGIGVEHRQLLNYIGAISERLGKGLRSYATVTTFAADLGHTMIFPALCSGATLHVIGVERAGSSEELGRYMSAHEVECLKIVPSHLQALLSDAQGGAVLPQRWLVLGGEAASAELVRRVQELQPDCRVLNHYGPTETTVGVLAGEVKPESVKRGERVALGRPLGNVRAYILDEAGTGVLPVWMRGELYIGGATVGRGYVKNAAETAARFVPDPFSEEEGARMYRTGDRARWRSDGQVEFLGRVDHQVKVRGYRVELGEVEAVLREHEEVRESVVVLREDRLVGYYVRREKRVDREHQSRELRSWLSGRLPEYMVPWVLLEVERLPLTANGKIDVRALPAPEEIARSSEESYEAPRTEIEEVLAGIWSEVLRVKRVGVRDNFFELGGHSLLAMQIISRVRETFQVELPLRILFDATSVEELARAMLAYESKPGQIENIARLLQKIKNMSSADIKAALEAKKNRKSMVSSGLSL
ncbi:MAG TPA: amino acid adenylation domain-containing protein [Pyrinomonadaceae bacterium]|nr:amino acid adenylation domain-containing protein [Pyrinomonadaceae bacterium]